MIWGGGLDVPGGVPADGGCNADGATATPGGVPAPEDGANAASGGTGASAGCCASAPGDCCVRGDKRPPVGESADPGDCCALGDSRPPSGCTDADEAGGEARPGMMGGAVSGAVAASVDTFVIGGVTGTSAQTTADQRARRLTIDSMTGISSKRVTRTGADLGEQCCAPWCFGAGTCDGDDKYHRPEKSHLSPTWMRGSHLSTRGSWCR